MSLPPVFLHSVASRVPENAYDQELIGEILRTRLEPGGVGERLSKRIYGVSGIRTRHSVIRSGHNGSESDGLFFDQETGAFLSPTTGERNDRYVEAARPMFSETGRAALEGSSFRAGDVTHVITVSCTGFFAPGPDYYMVRDLGLDPSTQRYHVGFMGCYAAFPALRMARAFCRADPGAVVLVVCLELCTVHLEPTEVVDNIVASSVFADGAAGVVVSSRNPSAARLELVHSVTHLAPDSEQDMAWRIGDRGFEMVLSTYVPKILGAQIGGIVDDLLEGTGTAREDIDHWLVHPGGRAILDHIEEALALPPAALGPSRRVLEANGNMSSATVLFVLEETLRNPGIAPGSLGYAMAFGPGLTVESALFRGV